MRLAFIVIVYLLAFNSSQAHPQDPVDSLKMLLKTHQPDTLRIKILNQLSFRISGNQSDLGIQYAQEALNISLKINYLSGISKSYNSLGICMRVKGDYVNSLDFFFKALQIDEKLYNDKETAKTLSGIGAVYVKLKNYDKGIAFFEQSLKLRQKAKDLLGVAVCYTNLGDIYEKKGDYKKAIDYHYQSLEIEKRISPLDVHYSLNSLGNVYFNIKDFTRAIQHYEEALTLRKSLKNKFIIAETSIALGRALTQTGRLDEAYGYLDEGLALAKTNQTKELEEKAYLYFSEYYEKRKSSDKALYYYKKYSIINDSLYNSEINKQSSLFQNKYQEGKILAQDKENQILKKNQDTQEHYYQKQRAISLLAISSGIISLGLAVFLLISSNKNQKINQLLKTKNQAIQEQHHQLTLQNHQITETQQQLEEMNEELQVFNHQLEEMVNERTEKMRTATEALQIAKDELDLFMYRVSHDFRGPLATLVGLANIGRNDTLDNTALAFFDKTESTAKKMSKMLDKLLMVNLISHKELQKSKINFDLLVHGIIDKLNPTANNLQVEINFSDNTFVSDIEIVEITLINLLENAFQFQKMASKAHQVKVFLEKQDEFVKITIEDNGVGIPKEYQQRMFEMFFRASESSQGNGLGLYIVKKAVEKLNGEIVVESEVDNFSRFIIMLPAMPEA
ncbi:MAG: tetratricopeptide repeat-containing sensor histidine kinase [Raineya sp.]|jgi:signal transduction histidine kinase|nr:tetratricopeptide repeat-containing sensor histidine kinase [Raineya sp.]